MSWRVDSTAGGAIWDTEPMSGSDLLCRDEEIRFLMRDQRKQWGLINGRLATKGKWLNPDYLRAMAAGQSGGFTTMHAIPPAATLANVASLSGEASLWSTSLFTPWLAGELSAPTGWRVLSSWQTATSTSPGNVTLNPRIGSVAAGSSSTGGIPLGADAAIALTASITTDWYMEGSLTVQSIGAPGANSKAIGSFNCVGKPATTGTGAATINDIFGFTQASFDASIASGFILGMANTVTTITYAVQQVHWLSLN